MEAMNSEGSVSSHGGADKIRKNQLVRRVTVECAIPGLTIGSGHVLQRGKATLEIFEKDLVNLRKQVRGPDEEEKIRHATEIFEAIVSEETHTALNGSVPVEVVHAVFDKSRAGEQLSDQEQFVMEKRRQVYQTTGKSIEGCFYRHFRRSIKPIISLKEETEAYEHPEFSEPKEREQMMIKTLIRELVGEAISERSGKSRQ